MGTNGKGRKTEMTDGSGSTSWTYTGSCGTPSTLTVDYVVVNGMTVQVEGPATIIDGGSGAAAFDWQNVTAGQETMTTYGSLRFVLGSQVFSLGYDYNGNMTAKLVNGARYLLTYDAENKLVGVSGALTAFFVYDGDGKRVKGTVASVTTSYIGNPSVPSGQGYFEWVSSTSDMNARSRFYYAGSTRVAMRTGASTLNYLLGDHSLVPRDRLGSTSITTDSSGALVSTIMYYPWGGRRYSYGSIPTIPRASGQAREHLDYYQQQRGQGLRYPIFSARDDKNTEAI